MPALQAQSPEFKLQSHKKRRQADFIKSRSLPVW
jgi:hypothetical protein